MKLFSKSYNILLTSMLFVLMIGKVRGQGATCAAATNVVVNAVCASSGNMTTAITAITGNATLNCGGTVKKELWYKFTTLNTTGTTTITVSHTGGYTATGKNIAFELLTSCSTATIACVNTTSMTETLSISLAANTLYYVRMVNTCTGALVQLNSITVCIQQPPVNDDPPGAINLVPGNGACSNYTFSNATTIATDCGVATPSCGAGTYLASSAGDMWYTATMPSPGLHIQTEKITGSLMDDNCISVYTGVPCAGGVEVACSDGNPNGSKLPTLMRDMSSLWIPNSLVAAGTLVYIRIWGKATGSGTGPGTTGKGTYSVCVSNMLCGEIPNQYNDYCSTPAPITTAASSFSSSVNSTGIYSYTSDTPGDLTNAAYCVATFDHNSWYSFIASANTQSFTFSTGTCGGGGISVEAFKVTKDIYGCCKTFSSMSVFFDPGASATPDCLASNSGSNTFTVTGLTIGTTYQLMVNAGSAAQSCTYTIANFAPTGVLPVEYTSFTAENVGSQNLIQWTTATEKYVDHYTIERSENGRSFEIVGSVKSKGSSQTNTYYSMYDTEPYPEITYYRIRQTNLSGTEEFSNTISVNLKALYDNIYNLQPNPTTSDMNFEYYSKPNNTMHIELITYSGSVVYKTDQRLDEGKNTIHLPMSELDNGIYILKVVSDKSQKATHYKVIKN